MNRTEILLEYMKSHLREYLDKLETAVRYETPTEGLHEDLDICREYYAALFRELGFTVNTVKSLNERFADHLLVEYGKDAGKAFENLGKWLEGGKKAGPYDGADSNQLLFGGHYDTVHEKGIFSENMWKTEGDKLMGPGILDMKGGDMMVYIIAKAYIDLGLLPEGSRIAFMLSSDEEAGSYGSSEIYKELARHSKATFIMESSVGIVGATDGAIGGLKCGRFGRGNYTFEAHGTPYHSGINPTLAESGLIELSRQAIALEEMTFFDRPNEKTGEPETVTVGCTCLKSGNAGWPTVPGDGQLTIDARFSTMELADEYDKLFKNMKSFNPNVSITTSGGLEKPPFDKDLPGNRKLQELAKEVGREFGVEMALGMVRGGSDGNFTASTGCPTLDGMGVTGGNVHQLGEYLVISHLPFRLAFTAEMGLRVLEG